MVIASLTGNHLLCLSTGEGGREQIGREMGREQIGGGGGSR